MTQNNAININGVEYVRADSIKPQPSMKRAIVVADKGFIFGGNIEEHTLFGRHGVLIVDAIIVRYWSNAATWAGVVNGPHEGVKLDRLNNSVFVADENVKSVIFVADNWAKS